MHPNEIQFVRRTEDGALVATKALESCLATANLHPDPAIRLAMCMAITDQVGRQTKENGHV